MKNIKLSNGVEMPILGFGVYQIPDLKECERVVSEAIEVGYRSIDTAQVYGNEEAVGNAIKKSGIDKKRIFYYEKVKAANPMTYISKNTPPFLLLHGDKDMLVSPSQTEKLHRALVAKWVVSTRYVVKGAAHGGEYWVQPEVIKVIIDFLDKNLKNK